MDTEAFRFVFDNLPRFTKVIPPKSNVVIDKYNSWLDTKKGLEKLTTQQTNK